MFAMVVLTAVVLVTLFRARVAMQALAWVYVAARVAHAYVHLGGNRIRHRLRVYFFSCLVLLAMWIYLVAAVILSRA